jgi:type IV pilus assembly protein PilB
MVAAATQNQLSGLGRAMVQKGWLAEREAEQLQVKANEAGVTFVEELIAAKKFGEAEVADFAAQTFGFPLIDLAGFETDHLPVKFIEAKALQGRRALPLYVRGNRLFVGISDPTNRAAMDQIKFQTGLHVEPVVVEDTKLGKIIERLLTAAGVNLKDLADEEMAAHLTEAEPEAMPEAATVEIDDAPVVRYIQKILLDAISSGASDIHFEPYEKVYRIRYRVDGELYEIATPPLAIKDKVASRIKVISRLDISEKRVPQDGRMKLVLSKQRAIDFRVSTLPTLFGEKLVLRILDSANVQLGIEALGYEPEQREALLAAINRPYGMILVTGPTGSGKTVSLYSCLNLLNQPGTNISTAEDPAEINLPGINQVNINEKAGLTFAVALKAFLRQDPDVIMVGEIRDLETGEIAIKAAQTGHLVLSTLHTNDAPTTLTRLMNMGIAPFNVATSVMLITAQRLARKLCANCRRPVDIPRPALLRAGFTEQELDGSWRPYMHVGCEVCKNSGYKGRTGLYQVMPISEQINTIIMKNGNAIEIAAQAKREGVKDMRQAGLVKVRQGITSLEEVEAVTNE